MLTFLSRSMREWLGFAGAREAAPHLRAVPRSVDLINNSRQLPAFSRTARLRVATADDHRDMPVAPEPVRVGATVFVAGQGARIYSLDVFRPRRGPPHPKAA